MGFDMFFFAYACLRNERKRKWVVYPLIITSTHETHTKNRQL